MKRILIVAYRYLPSSTKQGITQSKLYTYIHTRFLASDRSPRVYVKRGITRMEFLSILHQRKVNYVLLRWWQNLPEIPPGEDMDILVSDEHRDLIDDLVTFHNNGSDIMCDIYTVSGVKNGCRRNIPYFQPNLAHTLLKTRVMYRGAFVPSPLHYFASLAYHAVFHKGYRSGLSGFATGVAATCGVEHSYTAILEELAQKNRVEVDLSVSGLYEWLKQEGYAPADDTLTKLIEHRPELSILETPLASDARGGEMLVFVAREKLVEDGLLHDFKSFLEDQYNMDILDIRQLDTAEKEECSIRIRGGKWDKGPFKYSGGKPEALIVAYDFHPRPPDPAIHQNQIRMTNLNNMEAKYAYRAKTKSLILFKSDYNGVHSADNERDAWSYIDILGKDYRDLIAQQVETRRSRYRRIWPVQKVLSINKISKVELIKYGTSNAVKKTFRPGKERYFERELYAAKELSKKLEFIPPLLEEGDGYIVTPYLENILDHLSEYEKKKVLSSRYEEIIGIINSMYCRGLAYINFNPDSIIITPDNRLFCTGFEYLQSYQVVPASLEAAFEIAGVPKEFKGDLPESFKISSSSFNSVWGTYIGKWDSIPLSLVQAHPANLTIE
ncbi:hypothetical protein [Pontibacter ruber]|uniref:Lipopolysaccharide kinase (Kdo/WaaP) family protein n=1 Tax=Pontibacter ruber TaxID=1343895 RepID=A0ABW5CV34_9BACT|nr:hypothetical protein [Pontibacter ruber]